MTAPVPNFVARTGSTVAKHPSLGDGDLQLYASNNLGTAVAISGWTQKAFQTDGGGGQTTHATLLYKLIVSASGESANYTVTGGSGTLDGSIGRVPAGTFDPANPFGTSVGQAYSGAGSTIAAPAYTPATADECIIHCCAVWVDSAGFTKTTGYDSLLISRVEGDPMLVEQKGLSGQSGVSQGAGAITGGGSLQTCSITVGIRAAASTPTGTMAVTVAAFVMSASGNRGQTGTMAVTVAAFVMSATGTLGVTGTLTSTVAAFTMTASGTHLAPVTGTMAVTVAAFVMAASGTAAAPGATGTMASTIDPFTMTAAGTATPPTVTGTLDSTIAAFVMTATGTHTPPGASGSMAATYGAFVMAASGSTTVGSMAVTVAAFVMAATGGHGVSGTLAATVAPFVMAAAGNIGVVGVMAATIGPATMTAAGVALATGSMAATVAPFTMTATGTHTPPGGTPATITTLRARFDGVQKVAYGTINLGSYVTGGTPVTPAALSLYAITAMHVVPAGTDTTHTLVFTYVASSGRIQAFLTDAPGVTAGQLIEVANATDLSAVTANFRATGY